MDMYISVQNKLSRVFFEEDFKTIVTNSVSRLNDPSTDYLDDQFIEFVFGQNKTFTYNDDTINAIHYLFLNMSTDLFKKISTLKLPWTRLTKNQAHVLDFMFKNPSPIGLTDFINWININSIDWIGLNQTHWFLDKAIKKLKLSNVSEQEQLAWYEYFFTSNKKFLDKSIGYIVCYAHPSLVSRAIADGSNLNQTYGVLASTLLHLAFFKPEEITEQDVKIADMLIDAGLDLNNNNLNKYTPFEYLVANTSKWILHYLRKGGNPNVTCEFDKNILVTFIKQKCSIETFKELVELGVNYKYVDQHNFSLLHWATWFDLDEHIKYLYSLGQTDFCAIPKGVHDYYPKGLTPLHHVFMYGSIKTINWVISHAPQLVTKEYENSHGFLIKSAHAYLLENTKLSDQEKIHLYEQLRENIRQKHYADRPGAWFFHSSSYAIPTGRDLTKPFELRYKMTPYMQFK